MTSTGAKDEIWLVMEYAEGGELFTWVRHRRRRLREDEYRRLTYELLSGLAYLHNHGIIHRDIKPKNLLMADNTNDATLRIADFGLSRRLKHLKKDQAREEEAELGVSKTPHGLASTAYGVGMSRPSGWKRPRAVTRTFLGTADWMAPEMLVCACEGANGGYSFPVDVWAAGCVIYALMSGRMDDSSPYTPDDTATAGGTVDELERLFGAVLGDETLTFEKVPTEAKQLLTSLLKAAPHERLTASEALRHTWLRPIRDTTGLRLPPAAGASPPAHRSSTTRVHNTAALPPKSAGHAPHAPHTPHAQHAPSTTKRGSPSHQTNGGLIRMHGSPIASIVDWDYAEGLDARPSPRRVILPACSPLPSSQRSSPLSQPTGTSPLVPMPSTSHARGSSPSERQHPPPPRLRSRWSKIDSPEPVSHPMPRRPTWLKRMDLTPREPLQRGRPAAQSGHVTYGV